MSNKQRVMCNRERQEEDNPCFKVHDHRRNKRSANDHSNIVHWNTNSFDFQESVLSLKCMDEGGYDRAKCHAYYENYKACKTFWVSEIAPSQFIDLFFRWCASLRQGYSYRVSHPFQNHVISDRRSKGLHPCLPPLAERESVKKEYMQIK